MTAALRPLRLLVLLVAAAAAGCAGLPGHGSADPAACPVDVADQLLFAERLAAADAAGRARLAGESAAAATGDGRCAAARALRHALSLATPDHAGHDRAAARDLLAELARPDSALAPASRALARRELRRLDAIADVAAERDALERKLRMLTDIEHELGNPGESP